jgi:hypothetical protein
MFRRTLEGKNLSRKNLAWLAGGLNLCRVRPAKSGRAITYQAIGLHYTHKAFTPNRDRSFPAAYNCSSISSNAMQALNLVVNPQIAQQF